MTVSLATPLSGPVSLRVPFAPASVADVRHALEAWLSHQQVAEAAREDARLIVSELVGNAVRHASPLANGTVLVRWRHEGDQLLISVCDGGGVTSPARVEADADALGGRGLAIVETLSDAWWIERTGAMRAVHVRLDLPQSTV